MKKFFGIVLGLFSGLLVASAVQMMFGSAESTGLFWITTLIVWAATTYYITRGARTVSKVFARGFLIGAAEWMAMVAVSWIAAGRAVNDTINQATAAGMDAATTEATQAGAAIGGGLMAVMGTGISIFMAFACLIGFAIAYFMGREMKPEAAPAVN